MAAFACDAMLGGLARWLRAAGHDASWHPGIADPDLVALARREGRRLLSCDAGIFARDDVARGDPPALRVPQDRAPTAQLAHVLAALGLGRLEPRCMACGGELVELERASAQGEVPATTWQAHDRFWRCRACGRVLWRGAHWRRIAAELTRLGP